jgi:hypothetical protein
MIIKFYETFLLILFLTTILKLIVIPIRTIIDSINIYNKVCDKNTSHDYLAGNNFQGGTFYPCINRIRR